MKGASNSEQTVITKSAERQKTSLPKEQVENTNLHKPVLNKIMTTQNQCLNYNFVAPLTAKIKKKQSYSSYNFSYLSKKPPETNLKFF